MRMDRMKTCSGSISATRSSTRYPHRIRFPMTDHTRHSRHTSEGSLRSFGQQLCTCCPLTCACVQYQRGTGARRCRSISSSLASSLPTRRTDTVSITDALTHVKRPKARYQPHASLQSLPCPSQNTPALLAPCTSPERSLRRPASRSMDNKTQSTRCTREYLQISKQRPVLNQASLRDLSPAACMMYDSCQRTGVSHGLP